jgi:hypothetical protein
MLSYLCEERPWCKQIIAIAHNAKDFDLHFILNRAIFLKWHPELKKNGKKKVCMTMGNFKFIHSICFLPIPLRTLSCVFGLTASKSWCPLYFNKTENLDYVGQITDLKYYGVEEMGMSERAEFFD